MDRPANAWSKVTVNASFRTRLTWRGHARAGCKGKIARGSGLAQGTTPCMIGQGKMPFRYACRTNPGVMVRDKATMPSRFARLASGSSTRAAGGSTGG